MTNLKRILKYWYVPVLIILLSFVIRGCAEDGANNAKIELLEQNIRHRNKLIDGGRAEIKELELQLKRSVQREMKLRQDKHELDGKYRDLKKRKQKIKTVVINKTEYVPKEEYIILYDFTKELKEKFSLYIEADKNSDWNIGRIITGFENIVEEQKKNISDQEEIITRLKKKNRKWGLYAGFGITGNGDFELNLSIGYRIL